MNSASSPKLVRLSTAGYRRVWPKLTCSPSLNYLYIKMSTSNLFTWVQKTNINLPNSISQFHHQGITDTVRGDHHLNLNFMSDANYSRNRNKDHLDFINDLSGITPFVIISVLVLLVAIAFVYYLYCLYL